jgi:molybdopterin/thiamine biosynthesis adenylyltransferase
MSMTRSATSGSPLADSCVAVLGCGSVGGFAAWYLAAAGVGRILLADRDTLSVENVRRHVCGRNEVNQPKVSAVARFLHQRFPSLKMSAQKVCLRHRPETACELLRQSDLALVAVDDEGLKHMLDDIAHETGTPLVFAGVHGEGWAVEVILVDPRRATPCYACTARALGRVGFALQAIPPNSTYRGGPPGTPSEAWASADLGSIGPAAQLAAEVGIAVLLQQLKCAAPRQSLLISGASAWRLALQPVRALDLEPWQLRPFTVRQWPECPTCAGLSHAADRSELLHFLEDQP